MAHRMILNQTAWFGRGAVANIPAELIGKGYTKALVVTDPTLARNGVARRVTDHLDAAGFAYTVFDDVSANPTIENVQAGVAAFLAAGADCLVGIGGGSPQDACKAIGIIAANPEFADVRSLEGEAATKNPSVPMLAVATTAGTASEVTINYVLTDTAQQRKFVCVDPHDIPLVAIIDPDLMDGMPHGLRVATGMDALTHAIEGYTTLDAWELTDVLQLKAIEIIAAALPAAARGDASAVEKMALGQYMAGMGFSNVGLGLVHAMAHPLSAFYGTPHGIANGVLLPHVMAFNGGYTGSKLRDIAKAMGVPDTADLPLVQARQAAVDAVAALGHSLGVPSRLRDIRVVEADLPALAAAAYADICRAGNPRPVSESDILTLFRAIF
ncbi:MAG TPA: lactaldehyde reductase [Cellulomonas sp.]